ncbi:hypothetical protein BC832DRAFT_560417 [Gaertneriomyces semiglobifer]|nr:hypothetical protein BC832DRAFT_560417 [Gaertneriomyces semiglobifer]
MLAWASTAFSLWNACDVKIPVIYSNSGHSFRKYTHHALLCAFWASDAKTAKAHRRFRFQNHADLLTCPKLWSLELRRLNAAALTCHGRFQRFLSMNYIIICEATLMIPVGPAIAQF